MPRSKVRRHNKRTYRSGLESNIKKALVMYKVPHTYEEEKIGFVQPAMNRTYTPDFVFTSLGTGKKIYIETKGIWDASDRQKHLWIRQQHPDLDIRFIFSRAKSKIAKNSTTTYADVCEGRMRGAFKGVTWKYAEKKIPKEWIYE